MSPASTQIQCTSTSSKTFTVQTTGTIVCPISYIWNLGPNNHWKYNNASAQSSFTTATNSITLTPESGTTLPSDVKVTPVLDGVNQPELTSAVSWTTPNYGILGGGNICTGTSPSFYVYNTTSGSSYHWGYTSLLPNYGINVVQVNSPYSSQTTLTKLTDGVIALSVHVVNACQQATDVIRNVSVGGYSQTASLLSGYMLAYPPCQGQGCTVSPVSSSIQFSALNGYSGAAYLNCQNDLQLYNTELEGGTWSLISGTTSNWYSNIGTHLTFYGSQTGMLKFRLTSNNSCGNQYYDIYFYPTQYTYSQYSLYTLSPNPANSTLLVSVDENKLAKENIRATDGQDIKEITILDKMGMPLKKQNFGGHVRKTTVNISKLKPGFYILRIFDGANYTSLKFIKN
jgi:hypothetical protein